MSDQVTSGEINFRISNGKASLFSGDYCLVQGISVMVGTDSSDTVEMLLNSTDDYATTIQFGHEGLKASCSLSVQCQGGSGLLFCDLEIEQKPFQRNVSLTSEHGLTIHCDQVPDAKRWMVLARHKDWWSRPSFGTNVSVIPTRSQSLLFETQNGYLYFIPVSDGGYTAEIQGSNSSGLEPDSDGFSIGVSSNCGGLNACKAMVVAFGMASDPYAAIESPIVFAKSKFYSAPNLCGKRRVEIQNSFGWCSWDAFYHEVNEAGIRAKAAEFIAKGIPVGWMIIDDGWLTTKDQRLLSFSEDRTKFPSGLKALVHDLKTNYGVRSVGLWHSFAGYWGGVHPESELAKEYADNLFRTGNGTLVPYPLFAKGHAFWDAWYTYLEDVGIDFVKVDGQSALSNHLRYSFPIGTAAKESHAALEVAVANHFSQGLINCMGMATENIWNRSLSTISRNSDDYVPQDADGFAEHALQNVYNSLYHGQFYWGDWDMFWTRHVQSIQHSILRVISGGPIYCSDPVGGSVLEVIKPLVFSNGRIVRCDRTALPTVDILFGDPIHEPTLLKVFNTCRSALLIGCFHISIQDNPITGSVCFSDAGMHATGSSGFAYDVLSEQVFVCSEGSPVPVTLEKNGYALFQLIPKRSGITPIGLLEKYVPMAGILWEGEQRESSLFKVCDHGYFGFIVEKQTFVVSINGVPSIPHALQKIAGVAGAYKIACNAGDSIEIR